MWSSTLVLNPQHVRVLANELLATRIAERIGLPVPVTELIEVSPWLIENTPELRIRTRFVQRALPTWACAGNPLCH
jgi:hypothetical protein